MSDAKDFSVKAAELWRDLVNMAFDTREDLLPRLAEFLSGNQVESKASFLRKLKAVRAAGANGHGRDEVIARGQSWTLSLHAKIKRNGAEPSRVLSWRMPRSLADAIMSEDASPDAEEALCTRLNRVCGIETSEEFWEFINSTYIDMDDKELRHRAGIVPGKKKRR